MRKLILIAFTAFTLFSCSDDERSGAQRKVEYKILGNYSGLLSANRPDMYGEPTDSQVVEQLPSYDIIEYDTNVASATMTVEGTDGIPGEKITVETYMGGNLESINYGTADSNGIISITTTEAEF
jgi:hypothetical protein